MAGTGAVKLYKEMINKIYAWREVREKGFVMKEPHFHPYFELFYVESGACSFFIGNNMYDLHEGDFLLIPPDVFHYTRYPYFRSVRHPFIGCGFCLGEKHFLKRAVGHVMIQWPGKIDFRSLFDDLGNCVTGYTAAVCDVPFAES